LAAQPTTLYLFKEGMFYKAYNQNPMWFVQHIKAYKVTAKYIKTIQQEEYFIGFPIKYLNSFTLEPFALKKTRYYIHMYIVLSTYSQNQHSYSLYRPLIYLHENN